MSRPDLMPLAIAERSDPADFLGTLTRNSGREAPTLCADWTVRQVAAHIISYEDLSLGRVLLRAPRDPFSMPRRNHRVLDFAVTAPALPIRRNVRRLRLVATDLDWDTRRRARGDGLRGSSGDGDRRTARRAVRPGRAGRRDADRAPRQDERASTLSS